MLGFSIFWTNSMFNKTSIISFALLSVMFLTGCSSTKMRDVWQDEKFARDDIKDMLVVGFTANITNRMVFEREFVYQLEKRGVQAIASYKELGKHMAKKDELVEYLKTHDVTYVMVTYAGAQEVDKTYIKPTVTNYVTGGYPYAGYGPYGYGYSTFGGYWGPADVTTVQTPGYFDETTKTILVTSIYDAKTGEIKWTGRSATFEAQSVSLVTDEVAKVVWDHIK